MSQVYATEPQTAGRVIFETTHGPLEINLWSRECPATCKHFLQLCLDGYYENVLFHRIVPGFLVQAGALRYNPTATKTSSQKPQVMSMDQTGNLKDFQAYRRRVQADEALDRRPYELNSRIRFNHRGQVAMALGVETEGMGDDEMAVLQPQFFITLDETSELDGKHVCFGTVTGPTVFNALRIGNTDVDDETHQPTILEEAPRIERVKILENPIHSDIVPSPGVMPWIGPLAGDGVGGQVEKKKKRKGVKNLNVLSFGDEMEENDMNGGSGIKSSHDVIETKRFSKKVDKKLAEVVSKKDDQLGIDAQEATKAPNSKKRRVSEEKEEMAPPTEATPPDDTPEDADSEAPQPFVAYKASIDKRIQEPEPVTEEKMEQPILKKEKPPKMSLVEARRAKYENATKDKKKREEETMAKFMAFQSKVANKTIEAKKSEEGEDLAARLAKRSQKEEADQVEEDDSRRQGVTYHGQVLENDDDADKDWMKTRFKCRKHQDLDAKLGGDGRSAMDDYVVVDEKERGTGDRKEAHKHHHHHEKKRYKHSRT